MPNREDIALMAHLMRRAGFGASREELEADVVGRIEEAQHRRQLVEALAGSAELAWFDI